MTNSNLEIILKSAHRSLNDPDLRLIFIFFDLEMLPHTFFFLDLS